MSPHEDLSWTEYKSRMIELKRSFQPVIKSPLALAGVILIAFFLLIAVTSHLLVNPEDAYHLSFSESYCWSNPIISWATQTAPCPKGASFILGTDGFGRDLLKMLVLALPLDFSVAIAVVASAAAIGVVVGSISAWHGRKIDEATMRVTDIFFAFPGLVLALVFAALFGRTIQNLTMAVILVWWPTYVRLARGQVLAEKAKPYVQALMGLGAGSGRLIFLHIVPNTIYPILVQCTLDLGGVILTFSALTFLGFSPSPALPELGNLAADGIGHVFTAPWLIIFPGLTILIIALAFNLLGDGLRDVLDPRLRR